MTVLIVVMAVCLLCHRIEGFESHPLRQKPQKLNISRGDYSGVYR
jgi:hypothetical protein